MTKVAIEHTFTGPTGDYASGYDSTKTMLGQLIRQQTGSNSTDKYAGPLPVGVMRPYEGGAINPNIGTMNVCAIDAGNNIHWVFEIENSSAATVIRKIMLSTFNTSTGVWNIKGTITVTAPSSGTMPLIRGLAVQRHLYTTGTVIASTNSTTVTGTGTAWFSARYAEGARIGFGSTDPNDIKTWYYIAAGGITTDTSLTLTSVLKTAVPPNSPYVIDELRLYWGANGTTAICGIYAVKGVTYDDFTPASTAIPAATSTDNNKACYWLVDNASTQLNTQPQGIALSSTVSDTSQYMWVLDGATTTWRLYKHDVRAALTVSSGKSASSFLFRSSGMASNTGLNGTANSISCVTPNHGPGAGMESIYLVSAQNNQCRIVRLNANAIEGVTALSKYLIDTMVDVTPYPVSVGLNQSSSAICLRYMASIDRFIASNGYRFSIAKYNVDGSPIERIFNFDYKSSDQIGSVVPPYPANSTSFVATIACCNGILYVCRQYTVAGSPTYQSQTYAVPIGADWDYAAGTSSTYQNRLITPELSTPTCRRFYRLMVNNGTYLGTASLGLPPEPYRAYYRTGGISDNSGAWSLVQENGDLTGVGSSPSIQFMFEFRVAGAFMLSPKIYGLTCIYEDESTDSHYQPSLNFTNKTTKIFAWRFANSFGSTVPKLYVKIYESATGTLLIKDDTVNQSYGTFQKSTDGGYTWGSYNTTDKNNNTTYIRYTPTLLADNLKVRMVLTQ